MKNYKKTTRKYLLLMSVLMLMMLLCACRTRITNNTEVTSSITDEDGYLTETYDMRREELGIPVAQKPFFTGWGSPDEEDYSDYDGGDSFDSYDPYEEPWDEPDDTTTSSSSGSDSSSGSTSTSSTRRPSTSNNKKNTDKKTEVTITLDYNDGEGTKKEQKVKKDTTYAKAGLPSATRDGYTFSGWHTKKSTDSPVNMDDKVTSDVTLYAHWAKQAPAKKTYTVTFDGNGDGDDVKVEPGSITVEEDGTYGELAKASRNGCQFLGWFTDKKNGSQVNTGDPFKENKNQTLYAHWKTAKETWEETFSTDVNKVTAEKMVSCFVESGGSAGRKLIEECRGNRVESNDDKPVYIIAFIEDYSDEAAAAVGQDLFDQYSPDNDQLQQIFIISYDALTGDDNQKLLYKLMVLDSMYQAVGEDDINKAAEQLAVDGFYPYIFVPAAPPSPGE